MSEEKLKKAQQETEAAAQKTNEKINELGDYEGTLYSSLNGIQLIFDYYDKYVQLIRFRQKFVKKSMCRKCTFFNLSE